MGCEREQRHTLGTCPRGSSPCCTQISCMSGEVLGQFHKQSLHIQRALVAASFTSRYIWEACTSEWPKVSLRCSYIYIYILFIQLHTPHKQAWPNATSDEEIDIKANWSLWIIYNMNSLFLVAWGEARAYLVVYSPEHRGKLHEEVAATL